MIFKKKVEQNVPVKPAQKNIYLIDYENVHDTGLHGINELTSEDRVIIFYGSQDKSISYKSHQMLMQTKAIVEELQMEQASKNYLDFQLSTYLGYLIGTNHYLSITIVSKDTGYDSIVVFWKQRNIVIKRTTSIKPLQVQSATPILVPNFKPKKPTKKTSQQPTDASIKPQPNSKEVPNTTRKQVRKAVAEFKLPGQYYTAIYEAMAKSTDKNEYHNRINKSCKKNAKEIYDATASIYGNYRKALE